MKITRDELKEELRNAPKDRYIFGNSHDCPVIKEIVVRGSVKTFDEYSVLGKNGDRKKKHT